jgi:hypothetical protein
MLSCIPPAPKPPLSVHVSSFGQLTATRYTRAHGLPEGPCIAIRCTREGVYAWVGDRVYRFADNAWTMAPPAAAASRYSFSGTRGPNGDPALTLAHAKNGELWITTAAGAYRGGPGRW